MSKLTHIDDQGRARMVDVGDKAATRRRAEARCPLRCAPAILHFRSLIHDFSWPSNALFSGD